MAEPPEDIFDLMELKFLLMAPQDSRSNMDQTMFLVEHAYWYYEDNLRETQPNFRHFSGFEPFARWYFGRSKLLGQHAADFDNIYKAFNRYKLTIPVYGAILLDKDMERVLLVRGLKSSSGWGFPRGKVNQGERGDVCAAREVEEETGMNIESLIRTEDMIQVRSEGKLNTLYIVAGIDPDTAVFAPLTKGEIGAFTWHYVRDLPATTEEANKAYLSSAGTKHRFFMVQPFMRPLREWIRSRRVGQGARGRAPSRGGDAVGSQAEMGDLSIVAAREKPLAEVPQGPVTMASFRFDREAIMQALIL